MKGRGKTRLKSEKSEKGEGKEEAHKRWLWRAEQEGKRGKMGKNWKRRKGKGQVVPIERSTGRNLWRPDAKPPIDRLVRVWDQFRPDQGWTSNRSSSIGKIQ